MKTLILVSLLALAPKTYADLASDEAALPVIKKINASGYTGPSDFEYEVCEVFLNRVVITKEMGYGSNENPEQDPVIIKRVVPIVLSPNVYKMVRDASKEELVSSEPNVCDLPTTRVEANAPEAKGVLLFQSPSCSPRQERVGSNSRHLRDIVDTFCPLTNDFKSEDVPHEN